MQVSALRKKMLKSHSYSVTPSLDTHIGCRVGGVTEKKRKREDKRRRRIKEKQGIEFCMELVRICMDIFLEV